MRPTLAAAFLTLLVLPAVRADVTLRYKNDVKLNPGLPEQITEQAKKAMAATMSPESSQQFRNGKGLATFGPYTTICDFSKQMVTLLDTKGKRYATLPAAQLVDEMMKAMPQQPDEAKAAMAGMKGHFQSKPVSQTESIQGVEAEEHDFEMSFDAPAMPNLPEGPMMRIVMRMWMAKSSEIARLPAIREMAGYNLFAIATMNPMQMIQKMLPQMPGFGENIAAMTKEMQSGTGVVLRLRMATYMPMIGAMMKQHPEASPLGAAFDPDAPFMEMSKELVELSTAAVPDSVFQIPQGFQSTSAADIVRDLIGAAVAAAK